MPLDQHFQREEPAPAATDAAQLSAEPRAPAPRPAAARPRWVAPAGAALALGVALLVIFFQWNWLRGPLADAISLRIGRPVAIRGNLEVHPWSWTPEVTLNGLVIGNPGWAGPAPMAVIPRLTVRIGLTSLVLKDEWVLPLVEADHPTVRLVSDANGRSNWSFRVSLNPLRPPPRIGRLIVNAGALSYQDARRRIAFSGGFSSDEGAGRPGGGLSTLSGAVTMGGAPWAGPAPLLAAPRVRIEAQALQSMAQRRLVAPLIALDRPVLRLVSDAGGRTNWTLPRPAGPRRSAMAIGRVVVTGGQARYDDARRRIDFLGGFTTDEGPTRPGGGLTTIAGALTVGAAPRAGPAPTARTPHLLIEVKALPFLMRRQLALPLVEADGGMLRLVKDAAGRESWNVSGAPAKALQAPPIGRLVLKDVGFTYDEPGRLLHLAGALSSSETTTGTYGLGSFRLTGQGRLGTAPFGVEVSGGPLVNVDAARPWPFDARLSAGATRLALAGALTHPFSLAAVSGRLTASGPDLADLHPFTGLVLPRSPPYQLAAGFGRQNATYALRGLAGRVGESDLEGQLSVDDATGRPFVNADLASERLRLVDLAAVFGAAPPHAAGEPLSPTQAKVAARLAAENRLLPDQPLNVAGARRMDARVRYRAQSVESGPFPIRALAMNVVVDHGVIRADPVDMILPQGSLAGNVRIDGRGGTPLTSIDARLTNARLETLGKKSPYPALEGGLFAHVKVAGAGDSVRAAASTLSGAVTVAVPGGEIRQKLAELVSMDVARALYLYLSKSESQAPIRCGLVDMRAAGGVLTTDRLVLDTGPVLITGHGEIDLRNETLNFSIRGNPKGLRLVRLAAPITLTGALSKPKVGVDLIKAAPQLAASVAVGVFAAPAAAILPLLHIGEPKPPDCAALMRQAAGEGVAVAAK